MHFPRPKPLREVGTVSDLREEGKERKLEAYWRFIAVRKEEKKEAKWIE
jgi:hypothetical protein